MRRILIVGGLVLALFAGCTHCNLINVTPNLKFLLTEGDATALNEAPATVRTCLNGNCWDLASDDTSRESLIFDVQTRELTISTEVWDGGIGRRVETTERSDISLTASRDGGTLFTHQWSDVAFDSTEPNGKGCGITWQQKTPLTF